MAGALLRGIAHGEDVDVVVGEEFPIGGFVLIEADGEYLHPVFHLRSGLQGDKGRHFIHTGRAPRGPEIQHYHLAAKIV